LHPPSKADASYHISSRAPHLCVHQTGSRGDAETRRRGERKRSAHKAGWTGLHPFPEAGASRGTACPDRGSTYLRTAIIRYAGLAVGLMEIENIIRYTERAVGLKPSARQGEACLRGLYRSISSKTIRPRLCAAKPACVGESGLFVRRPSARRRRSPIGYRLSAIPQPHGKLSYRLLAIGYQLSAMECEARLRVARTPTMTLSPLASHLSPLASRAMPFQ
jgi:hypothetical protein